MTGRGAPPNQAPVQPPVHSSGQNHRAPGHPGRTATPTAAAGAPAVAGAPTLAVANRQQPRGHWGDDGVNAYGEGQHRGSSSSGDGRGYAWRNNGGGTNGFSGPPGKFAPGVAGPPHPKRGGFRPSWGGRGGGRKPRQPIHPQEAPAMPAEAPLVPTLDQTKEGSIQGQAQGQPKGVDSSLVDKNNTHGKLEGS
ncbi:hypothetical protein ZWY2020_015588 [Hordeum vulgare]|nr:hypothetical protein ZWY2020_015588 [Hordeum vulgare]